MPGTCRFAPSATGRAHPGTLLAALLCWLDARQRGDRVVLRLEDLDPERCSPALVAGLREDLAWFGLDWDLVETQSEQAARHAAALDALAARGLLYPCPLSRTELQVIGVRGADGAFQTDNRNRGRPLPPGGWRECPEPLRVNLGAGLADPVVRRRDHAIAYHLASVVDDAAVGVTRVVRGRDLAPSTALQVALQDVLGLPTPIYHHHALLLEADGAAKLAKFHGAVAVPELRNHLSAAELCGILAHAVGLIAHVQPLRPADLLADFCWSRVTAVDRAMAWDGARLRLISAEEPIASAALQLTHAFAWSTPAAPAAIALVEVPALAALIDRPLPVIGTSCFARLIDRAGTVIDELVADRRSRDRLRLMPHGGPGVRAAVTACLLGHGLHQMAAISGGDFTPEWLALAAAPSPAAVAWLLAHPGQTPPFSAEFLHRTPLVLITGPTNAGKSTLLNYLCGHRRALVSDLPGTTRDLLAAETIIAGWRIRLLDSAGLRVTDDPLEQAGQALVAAARQRADLVLYLSPPGNDQPPEPTDLVVLGKADLRDPAASGLRWSANDAAAGLARLGLAVRERLGLPAGPSG